MGERENREHARFEMFFNVRDQVYCTDQACNDFWELAGGLPVNACTCT